MSDDHPAKFARRGPTDWARDLRWEITSSWSRLRGRTGEFRAGETSERAERLTELWDSKWGASQPAGDRLRYAYRERWVRLHSLPNSKQYADTGDEYAEILRRHRVLLDELRGDAAIEELLVIAADYERHSVTSGWTKTHLPTGWPSRRFRNPEDFGDSNDHGLSYFWITSNLGPAQLDDLLLLVADDAAQVALTDPELNWMYCPYAGGADVVLATPAQRDALRAQHLDWLPTTTPRA